MTQKRANLALKIEALEQEVQRLREVLERRLPHIYTCPRCGMAYYTSVGHYCFTWNPTITTNPIITTSGTTTSGTTSTISYTPVDVNAPSSIQPASNWIDTSMTGTSAVPIIPLEFWRSTAGPDTPDS